MTPLEVLREAGRLGVRLEAREGAIRASPPGRLPLEVRARIVEAKGALLEALEHPRRTASQAFEAAEEAIESAFPAHASARRARCPDSIWAEYALDDVMDARTLAKALEEIAAWQAGCLCALLEKRQCPNCGCFFDPVDFDTMSWVGSGAKAARWCMHCALGREAEKSRTEWAGVPLAAPPGVEKIAVGPYRGFQIQAAPTCPDPARREHLSALVTAYSLPSTKRREHLDVLDSAFEAVTGGSIKPTNGGKHE